MSNPSPKTLENRLQTLTDRLNRVKAANFKVPANINPAILHHTATVLTLAVKDTGAKLTSTGQITFERSFSPENRGAFKEIIEENRVIKLADYLRTISYNDGEPNSLPDAIRALGIALGEKLGIDPESPTR